MTPLALEGLPSELKQRAEGTNQFAIIRDTRTRFQLQDDGSRVLIVTIVLADPPEDMETWPVEELWKLRRIAGEVVPRAFDDMLSEALLQAADELGVKVDALVDRLPRYSWIIEFEPETVPPLSPDQQSFAL